MDGSGEVASDDRVGGARRRFQKSPSREGNDMDRLLWYVWWTLSREQISENIGL